MKILHTSDWHIGKILFGRKRYEEYESFLNWLIQTIDEQQVDVLLVAGDVFDNGTPSNRSQELYYRFLCRVAATECRHVIVTAGNHDSPSFLDAPREILKALDVHVIGSVDENVEREILVLNNRENEPEIIVCAVPYLRDRDIRTVEAGESIEGKEQKLIEGLRTHYAEVGNFAQKKRQELGTDIPIIAMGHLLVAGGQTIDGDGVRELYIGSLAHVSAAIFPECIDYLALGHLHVPQKVGGSEVMRYSGSPLPMGFGEAKQEKSACLVEFTGKNPIVSLLKIPVFQQLECIRGPWDAIHSRIVELSALKKDVWLEIIYEGTEIISDLRERLETLVAQTKLEVLRVKNTRIIDSVLNQIHDNETLDDLSVNDVFKRCLTIQDVPCEQWPELLRTYEETVTSLIEKDSLAE